jgi:uncharacterized membrane protein
LLTVSTIEASIEVAVPVSTAYNQWTQYESFPRFMQGVEEVRQLTDTTTHWRVSIGGVAREFDAEITEQTPDQRIAWRSTEGTGHAGVVTFHKLDDAVTKIMLQLDTEPQGIVEKAGDAIGLPRRDAKADLRNFKEFIEERGSESGAWRGDVDRDS